MKYYYSETVGGYRVAELLKAKNLADAKREAERNQAFYGTDLKIGTSINEQGFILDFIAIKEDGMKWQDCRDWE